jgi:hypothetical protein
MLEIASLHPIRAQGRAPVKMTNQSDVVVDIRNKGEGGCDVGGAPAQPCPQDEIEVFQQHG